MARKRYTTEQIIGLLREAEVRLGQGQTIVGFTPEHLGGSTRADYLHCLLLINPHRPLLHCAAGSDALYAFFRPDAGS